MSRKVVLVTGAGGFIGRWSVPPLIERGYEVHAVLSRSSTRDIPPEIKGAVVHRADLLDLESGASLMARVKPSHFLHFAWIATPGVYWASAANYRWLEASRHLLGAFKSEDPDSKSSRSDTCTTAPSSWVGMSRFEDRDSTACTW